MDGLIRISNATGQTALPPSCSVGFALSKRRQFLQDVLCESVVDLSMPWNRLCHTSLRVLIPVMVAAVSDDRRAGVLEVFG